MLWFFLLCLIGFKFVLQAAQALITDYEANLSKIFWRAQVASLKIRDD